MEFLQYKLSTSLKLEYCSFVSEETSKFLLESEEAIYSTWFDRNNVNSRDVSLAKTITDSVLDKLESREITELFLNYRMVMHGFQHESSIPKLLFEIFKDYKIRGIENFIIFTQTEEFKTRNNYDSSTITLTTFYKVLIEFIEILQIKKIPHLYFVVFDKVNFDIHYHTIGKKKYIQLKR